MKQEIVPIVAFFTAIRNEEFGQLEIVCTKLKDLFDVILLSDEQKVLKRAERILREGNMLHGEYNIMDKANIFRKHMVLIDTFSNIEDAIEFANKLEYCLRMYYE